MVNGSRPFSLVTAKIICLSASVSGLCISFFAFLDFYFSASQTTVIVHYSCNQKFPILLWLAKQKSVKGEQ